MRLGVLALACVAVACGNDESANVRTGQVRQPIISGTASPEVQNFVVQLARSFHDQWGPVCSASLVAKNLILTARHCTGDVNDATETVVTYNPSQLGVYVGQTAGQRTSTDQPDAQAVKIFSAGADGNLYPDIALIQLDRALDAPTVPIRLASGALRGEHLTIVGYGITERAEEPAQRLQRENITIQHIAPDTTQFETLHPGEFQFGEAACSGDSGGPAISVGTGAVIGVASRVGNGKSLPTQGSVAFCRGSTAEDIYTGLNVAKATIDEAFTAAGAQAWLEGDDSPEQKAAAAAAAAQAKADAANKAAADDGGCSLRGPVSHDCAFDGGLVLAAALLVARSRRRA